MLVQYFINHYIFSSIKETNWLINKRMYLLLFDVFKHLLLTKTDVLKTFKTFILALLSSAVFRLENCVTDFF